MSEEQSWDTYGLLNLAELLELLAEGGIIGVPRKASESFINILSIRGEAHAYPIKSLDIFAGRTDL